MSLLNIALEYLKHNFSIIPCGRDKKPLIKWIEFQNRKPTEEEVRGWFRKWPDANIGLVTGKISGIVVVDIDDMEQGPKNLSKYIDLKVETPSASTPRGGAHLFFKHPGLELNNNAKAVLGCDFRGDGGYVLVAPSQNLEGKKYEWATSLFNTPLADLPKAYIDFVKNSARRYDEKPKEEAQISEMFSEGRRDDDLFNLANHLVKGGMDAPKIEVVLNRIVSTWGERDPKWVSDKVKSAWERTQRKERNLAVEIEEWIRDIAADLFYNTEICQFFQFNTHNDRKAVSNILNRLAEKKIITKLEDRTGHWKKIDNTEMEFMDFVNVSNEGLLDLILPLGIEKKTKIFPKAVIVLAGVTGFGKTTFLLNIVQQNMHKYNFYYFNAEMSPLALNHKLQYFNFPVDQWKMKVIPDDKWDYLTVADKIYPDDINVIDYLEPDGEKPYGIHNVVTNIIKRLDKGIAIISTQKRQDADLSAGGVYSAKAASLYLSLDWGRIKIFKNRYREEDPNPGLVLRDFEVIGNGQIIRELGGWYNESKKKKEETKRTYATEAGRDEGEGGYIR